MASVVASRLGFRLINEHIILRVAREAGLDPHVVADVRESDAARADYLRQFYGAEDELPTLYDLVVNTDRLSLEQAAELVLGAVGSSLDTP